MKLTVSILAIVGMMLLAIGCGPDVEAIKAKENQTADSLSQDLESTTKTVEEKAKSVEQSVDELLKD